MRVFKYHSSEFCLKTKLVSHLENLGDTIVTFIFLQFNLNLQFNLLIKQQQYNQQDLLNTSITQATHNNSTKVFVGSHFWNNNTD